MSGKDTLKTLAAAYSPTWARRYNQLHRLQTIIESEAAPSSSTVADDRWSEVTDKLKKSFETHQKSRNKKLMIEVHRHLSSIGLKCSHQPHLIPALVSSDLPDLPEALNLYLSELEAKCSASRQKIQYSHTAGILFYPRKPTSSCSRDTHSENPETTLEEKPPPTPQT